jgi:hypothetical protein
VLLDNASAIQINSTWYRSPYFNLSVWGVWNCSVYAKDSSNASVRVDHIFQVLREWQKYYGATIGKLLLGSELGKFLINWSSSHGKTVYVAEPSVDIKFNYIYPLGVCPNGSLHIGPGINDFAQADQSLGISSSSSRTIREYFDSNNDSIADNNQTFYVFGSNVSNVPIAKITPTSPFATGIFYQGQSGSSTCYNGLQDLIFGVKISLNASGTYGTADYELMIPMELATYKNSSNSLVTFYGEYSGTD